MPPGEPTGDIAHPAGGRITKPSMSHSLPVYSITCTHLPYLIKTHLAITSLTNPSITFIFKEGCHISVTGLYPVAYDFHRTCSSYSFKLHRIFFRKGFVLTRSWTVLSSFPGHPFLNFNVPRNHLGNLAKNAGLTPSACDSFGDSLVLMRSPVMLMLLGQVHATSKTKARLPWKEPKGSSRPTTPMLEGHAASWGHPAAPCGSGSM